MESQPDKTQGDSTTDEIRTLVRAASPAIELHAYRPHHDGTTAKYIAVGISRSNERSFDRDYSSARELRRSACPATTAPRQKITSRLLNTELLIRNAGR